MNLHCWMFGHEVTGQLVEKSYLTTRGELVSSYKYHCARCPTTDEYPDRRNIFQRSCILLWLRRWLNRWYFYRLKRV